MAQTLCITPIPFKSSRLTIPPSPTSPLTPLVLPFPHPIKRAELRVLPVQEYAELPREPLQWRWRCHVCRRTYHLPTTNRCLDDGHKFCSGVTILKRSKKTGQKVKKHMSCSSEFDYDGWRRYGEWKGSLIDRSGDSVLEKNVTVSTKKDCWNNCNYPSECRHGKHLATPVVPSTPTATAIENKTDGNGLGSFRPSHEPDSGSAAPTSQQVEARVPLSEDVAQSEARGRRRRSSSSPSPLSLHPPEDSDSIEGSLLQEAIARFGTDVVDILNQSSVYLRRMNR